MEKILPIEHDCIKELETLLKEKNMNTWRISDRVKGIKWLFSKTLVDIRTICGTGRLTTHKENKMIDEDSFLAQFMTEDNKIILIGCPIEKKYANNGDFIVQIWIFDQEKGLYTIEKEFENYDSKPTYNSINVKFYGLDAFRKMSSIRNQTGKEGYLFSSMGIKPNFEAEVYNEDVKKCNGQLLKYVDQKMAWEQSAPRKIAESIKGLTKRIHR